MSIQKLKIAGFRSLKDVVWEPGRLNVIIGPNGSGKSNLIRALALLVRSAQRELSQEIVSMGGIAPLLWEGQAQGISWVLETKPSEDGRGPATGALTYELCLRQLGMSSTYRVDYEQLSAKVNEVSRNGEEPQKILERRPGHAFTFDAQEHRMVAHDGAVPDDQTLLSLVAGPFADPRVMGFRDTLARWAIYHDVRVDSGAPLRQASVATMENQVAPDGQNLIPVLHTLYTGDREFKRTVDAAMRAAFGTDYEELLFPPATHQRVELRLRWRSSRREQSAADLSDGTLRFLLLIVLLASAAPGDLVAVDQPEVGLNPGMFPIVAELAEEASERAQILFTTHSPPLLDAFKRESPTTTVTQWISGETRLSVVDGEDLRRYLKQYSLGALFQTGELDGMA